MSAALLLSTFPNINSARSAVHTLVEEKLAACGSMAPGLESIYSWQGHIETSKEVLVLIKTTTERVSDALYRLRSLHPYEVPEIVELPIIGGWPEYLSWIEDSVTAGSSTEVV